MIPRRKNILVYDAVNSAGLERLRSIPDVCVDTIENEEEELRELPPEQIADVHCMLCAIPPQNVAEMQSLEVIQLSTVGYSQLYGLKLADRSVRVCNARGVFDVPIAEWNIAMMINLLRNMRGMFRNQETGTWDRSETFQRELRGSVVGIWGYGGIGRETARLCKSLGLTVHVLSRFGVGPRVNTYCVPFVGDPGGSLPDRVFLSDKLNEFLSDLDFLILCMPLTRVTAGIVGERELKLLPSHAFVLNPARGPLIEESALLRALRESWIAGAALDTHYQYPMPADHPLWHFPNVIMTPHISGSNRSSHFKERIWDLFVNNAKRYLGGDLLLNQLSHSQLGGD